MKVCTRILSYSLAVLLALPFFGGCAAAPPAETEEIRSEAPDDLEWTAATPSSDAFALLREMGVGWNLGNTLDSIDYKRTTRPETGATPEIYYETLWGNPVTTRKTMQAVADAGFGAVRIPVSWYDHTDENFQIRKAWLDRVEEVAGYALDAGLYCIINLHHDRNWLVADPARMETVEARFRTVWEQIAHRFRDYDSKLLFEGYNEILDRDENWSNPRRSVYTAANRLAQVFVDTVRASGGNNTDRFLVVNTYGAGVSPEILRGFQLPEDSASDRLIVGVHTYLPAQFTWTSSQHGGSDKRTRWDEALYGPELETVFAALHETFVSRGIPVLLGETAAWNKNNTAARAEYAAFLVRTAAEYHITCFWWDDGGRFSSRTQVSGSGLLDRQTGRWFFPEIVSALVQGEPPPSR